MAYKKNRQSEDVYRQKSYFHFRFNTNSGGSFPMQSIFYLKSQGHQLWALNYPKICRFLLTFSILQYLIGFIFLSNNVGIHFLFTYYFPIRSFRLVPMFSGNRGCHREMGWNQQIMMLENGRFHHSMYLGIL